MGDKKYIYYGLFFIFVQIIAILRNLTDNYSYFFWFCDFILFSAKNIPLRSWMKSRISVNSSAVISSSPSACPCILFTLIPTAFVRPETSRSLDGRLGEFV